MKIFNILVFLCFFLIFNVSKSEIINEIKIYGNDKINVETIELFSKTSVGDDVSDLDLNNIIKNLYETNFFSEIKVNLDNQILKIYITENKIIENFEIIGIKSKELTKNLNELILTKTKSPYIDVIILEDLNKIETYLKEIGFYFSNVEVIKKEKLNNTVDVQFNVELGKKAYINEIIFLGDKKYKKNKLLSIITSEENKFWKIISNKKLINSDRINLDKRLLLSFYKNKGFYDVKINDDIIQYTGNNNFKLIFNIDPGKKFYFDKVSISLPEDYDEKHFKNLKDKINAYSNKIYSYQIIEKLLKEIESIATDKNYEFVNANINEKIIENDKILVEIEIIDDAFKSYISKINILGNNITIEDVIRNQLAIDEGDPFNQILFSKSINNIKSTNLFKNVTTNVKSELNDDTKKIIDIQIEEKPTGEISLGAGIGTSGPSTVFGVKENNFLGHGIKLDTNLYLSTNTIKGLFSYVKPNYKNSNKDLIFSVERQETDYLKDFGYSTKKNALTYGTRFEQLDDLFITPTFSINYENIETSTTASTLLQKQQGDYFDIDVNYKLDFDKRNQKYQPSDGTRSIFTQKLPLNISENQTIINSFEFTSYHEYLDDHVATISVFSQAANSIGNEDVRISERLYMPARKLRGFEYGKIGPVDNGDYIGGNYLTSLNLSTNLPILYNVEMLNFNLFYDAANIWGVDYNSSINDSNYLRSATGLSIDWFTPVGPLNFSFSQPLTKKSTDITETFRFNLGTTF